ncbi:hypothetical protein GC194_11760 [bacterium]|nr:hypothetical protein [bacterium]
MYLLRLLLLAWLMCISAFCVRAQTEKPFPANTAQVLRRSKHVLFQRWVGGKKLTKKLTQNFKTDEEKALAISNWIICNLSFDYRGFMRYRSDIRSSAVVMRKGKALPAEFCVLFVEMCESEGIEAMIIEGYKKPTEFLPGDSIVFANHYWNLVKLNGTWYALDLWRANGFFEWRKMRFRKLLLKLFNIPYVPRLKFVQQTNLSWIYPATDDLLRVQVPVVANFQMRYPQLPLSVFYESDDSVRTFLSVDTGKYAGYLVDQLHDLTSYDKEMQISKKALQYNPLNHNSAAKAVYNAFFERLNNHYGFDENIKSDKPEALYELDSIGTLADSLLDLSLLDVNQYYEKQFDRNNKWRSERMEHDRELIRRIYALRRHKQAILKMRYADKNRLKRALATMGKTREKVSALSINEVERRDRPNSEGFDSLKFEKEWKEKKYAIDSLQKCLSRFMDGQLCMRNKLTLQAMNLSYKNHNKFYAFLVANWYFSFFDASFIHFDDFYLSKTDYYNKLQQLQSLNQTAYVRPTRYQDSLIMDFNRYLMAYIGAVIAGLKFLEASKRTNFYNTGEEELYRQLQTDCDSLLGNEIRYSTRLYDLQRYSIELLHKELRLLPRMGTWMKRDIISENFRYHYLRGYLQHKKNYHRQIIQSYKNHLRSYTNTIKRNIVLYEKKEL